MSWQVDITSIAKKRIAKIPQPERCRILDAINRLEDGLVGDVKPLKGCEDWRLRVGGWRILLSVDLKQRIIKVEFIDTRGDIYKH